MTTTNSQLSDHITGQIDGLANGSPRAVAQAAEMRAAAAATAEAVADGAVAIATQGLAKQYRGGQLAVDGLDLTVPAGSVFGFLGPNGSGKTTTIRMLMGLIAPTAGQAQVLGEVVMLHGGRALPRVGALIEGPAHYPYLTGAQNLARYDAADCAADPRTRAARVAGALERVGLTNAADKRAKAYSLGMKQRLGLASALLQPRDLLILDEPTNGLDPQGMREIRSLISNLAADGTTVFLSSHLLDEIEQVCTHVAVMNHGRLITQGPVAELYAAQQARLTVTTSDRDLAAAVLREAGGTDLSVTPTAVSCVAADLVPEAVCAALVGAGVRVAGFGVQRATLEDAFVALTGEGFDVDE